MKEMEWQFWRLLAEARQKTDREIYKKISLRWVEVWFRWQSKKNLMGRFGGGWNWELGFQLGSTTLMVNLLIFSVGIKFRRSHAQSKRRVF